MSASSSTHTNSRPNSRPNSSSDAKQGIWREPHGALPNNLALLYTFAGHGLGLFLLTRPHWLALLAGILLTAHTLVVAAYLIHEAAHMTLFRQQRHNRLLGEILLWVTGGGYASFDRIRHMHLRHHQDRADVSCFDYQAFLQRQPNWIGKLVVFLEWLYLPAVELIMHYQVIIRPFIDQQLAGYRRRVILVGISRLALFALLFWLSPVALLGYAIAYLLMIQALFLADAFAHTYDAFFVTQPAEAVPGNDRDREYDTAHTYSNLVSTRYPWLNLLNLNFGFHTAHHARASVAWHDLPAYHRELYKDHTHEQVLPYRELLKTIHRNRTRRVFVEDYGDVGSGPQRADAFVGAHGVSFLSIV